MAKLHRCVILRNWHCHSAFSNHHPDWPAQPNTEAKASASIKVMPSKAQMMVSNFVNNILKLRHGHFFNRHNAIAHLINYNIV